MKFVQVVLLPFCLLVATSRVVRAADDTVAPAPVEATAPEKPSPSVLDDFDLMMTSVQNDDYVGCLVGTDENFKMALTKKLFEGAVALVKPRMDKGYNSLYLGHLKERGYDVYLWKLSFKDGGDDMLANMSVKDGKIGGFFLL